MKGFQKISVVIFSSLLMWNCSKNTVEKTELNTEQPQTTEIQNETTGSELSAETSAVENSMSATSSNLSAEVSNLNIDINLAADQLFEFDKADLKPEAEAELTKAYSQFENQPKAKVVIVGYTDGKGSAAYNKDLSLRRANAVKEWFQKKGSQNNIFVEGKGADNPVAPNKNPDGSDNPEGRAKNRRVEIKVSGQKSI